MSPKEQEAIVALCLMAALADGSKSEPEQARLKEIFDGLEDGGVGYNFLTVAEPTAERLAIAEEIARVGAELQQLAGRPW